MKVKTYFLLPVIFLLVSCSPILKMAYGIKDPKITDTEKTQKYLVKKNIQGKDVYFNSAKDLGQATKGNFNLPDAIFYNKEGQQVEFRVSASECANDITKFIENINQINFLPEKEGISLGELLQHISDSEGNSIIADTSADAFVFLNWATYMGKLNKSVFEWADVLQKSSDNNIKVEYYLMSFDFLDRWEDKDLLTEKKKDK